MITNASQLISTLQEKARELNVPLETLEVIFLENRAHLKIEEIYVETNDGRNLLVLEGLKAARARRLADNWKGKPIPKEIATQCIAAYENLTAVILTPAALEEILKNYSITRHEICAAGLKNNTTLLRKFATRITQFFIKRDWPKEASQSQYESLVERIQNKATSAGFQINITPHKKAPNLSK